MANMETKICRQCQKEIKDGKNEAQMNSTKPIQYAWNSYDVCKKCYDEISAEVNKGWKYEDFWQVEKKYSRIFKQGTYANKAKNKNWIQRLFAKFHFYI